MMKESTESTDVITTMPPTDKIRVIFFQAELACTIFFTLEYLVDIFSYIIQYVSCFRLCFNTSKILPIDHVNLSYELRRAAQQV